MGAFVVNFHVRSTDVLGVGQQIRDCGAQHYRVTDPLRGWISIYEARASDQDEQWIENLSRELSGRLNTACVAFLLHDSDIARYWLHDEGQLLDEFNSIPDYFDSVSAAERKRLRGQPDVFVRYCQRGITRRQINDVLRADVTFADDTVAQLAEFLGIDPESALEDFRHDGDDFGGGGRDGGDGVDADNDDDGGPATLQFPQGGLLQKLRQQITSQLQPTSDASTSAQSAALVQAAIDGDTAEIERLVAAGADVNAEGIMTIQLPTAVQLPAAMLPSVNVSPLLAAASKGQVAAVRLLLESGANATHVNPIYGTALHAAVQAGSVETVKFLILAGVPADIKNTYGQTPLALVQALRANIELAKQMMRSKPQLRGMYNQFLSRLSQLGASAEGWEECERFLTQAN